ncbi:MAG: hypothetical protein ACTSRR_09860 [Candidatus Heimdallarchaeaceae archaeon]
MIYKNLPNPPIHQFGKKTTLRLGCSRFNIFLLEPFNIGSNIVLLLGRWGFLTLSKGEKRVLKKLQKQNKVKEKESKKE